MADKKLKNQKVNIKCGEIIFYRSYVAKSRNYG